MDTLGDRIRQARTRNGLTLQKLADMVGVTPSAVAQWEANRTALDVRRAIDLSKALEISLQWLIEGDAPIQAAPSFDPRKLAPLVNRVTAGTWSEIVTPQDIPDSATFLELAKRPSGFALALEIDGESMLPEFQPGDVIVIDTGLEPLPGDYVVAVLENEPYSTFKRYRLKGTNEDGEPIIELVPLNPDYPTLTINGSNPGKLVGTLVEHRRYRRRR